MYPSGKQDRNAECIKWCHYHNDALYTLDAQCISDFTAIPESLIRSSSVAIFGGEGNQNAHISKYACIPSDSVSVRPPVHLVISIPALEILHKYRQKLSPKETFYIPLPYVTVVWRFTR